MQIPQLAKLRAAHLDVMNFLNEIMLQYPSAISFAPGRPADQFCDVAGSFDYLAQFAAYLASAHGLAVARVRQQIGQYHKTNGIINELVCRFLAQDENIQIHPEALMITNGAQEAMAILAAGLFDQAQDVLLVADPTYIGMTGIASILGIELQLVPTNDEGLDLEDLHRAVQHVRKQGKTPKALYLIPDFSNPLGTSMTYDTRCTLLRLAEEQNLILLEDNPYGMLAYVTPPAPTLKSLDRSGVVIYLGTFAKSLFPGLRVGFLVADQQITDTDSGSVHYLAQELSKVKSLISVTTSPLVQAIIGGILLESQCSLRKSLQSKITFYRANRDQMLQSLEEHFSSDALLATRVAWNRPAGGFFLTVALPFAFGTEHLQICAEHYGVICCPMSFFSLSPGREHQVRLSFSAIAPEDIAEGIYRFWKFVRDTVAI